MLDEQEYAALDPAARRLVDRRLDRRDRREDGGAGRRRKNRAPAFLLSDDDEPADPNAALLGRRRFRRHWDEVPEGDNEEGADEMLPLEQLSDIKAPSLKEWIESERVQKTIMREFKQFLVTYWNTEGSSVYGQRIKALGEGKFIQSLIQNSQF